MPDKLFKIATVLIVIGLGLIIFGTSTLIRTELGDDSAFYISLIGLMIIIFSIALMAFASLYTPKKKLEGTN